MTADIVTAIKPQPCDTNSILPGTQPTAFLPHAPTGGAPNTAAMVLSSSGSGSPVPGAKMSRRPAVITTAEVRPTISLTYPGTMFVRDDEPTQTR